MNERLYGCEENLALYYDFNEGVGTEIYDKANHTYSLFNGTINWENTTPPLDECAGPGETGNPLLVDTDWYRYGFNGMEKDDEVKGRGNDYTTAFRKYDARLGRWLSVDPKWSLFPGQSPYAGMDNNPVVNNDPEGDCTICDQLEKFGIIFDRGFLGRDLIEIKRDISVSEVSYSPKLEDFSMRRFLPQVLFNAEIPVEIVSETFIESTLKFSESGDEVTIIKVTQNTIVELSGQEVVSSYMITKTERITLGVNNTSSTLEIEYQLPLVDQVNTTVSSKRIEASNLSQGLKRKVGEVKSYNKATIDRNLDRHEENIREDWAKDMLENSRDPGISSPSDDAKRNN